MSGHLSIDKRFTIDTSHVNIRVKNINRLAIPGSFKISLLRGETVIASRAMSQPGDPSSVEECVQNPIVDFDFDLPVGELTDEQMSVRIEPLDKSKYGDKMPTSLIGSPTVNIRFLLNEVVN